MEENNHSDKDNKEENVTPEETDSPEKGENFRETAGSGKSGSDKDDRKDNRKYEDICYICRRPESKAGRMIHIPNTNHMCICIDCLERSFQLMGSSFDLNNMQNLNKASNMPQFMDLSELLNSLNISPGDSIPQNQQLKKQREEKKPEPEFDIHNIPAPHVIKQRLDEYVIGQDYAKKVVSVAVYNHYKRVATNTMDDIEIEKSNILMIGPTGSGKTYIVQTMAKLLDVPLAITDATSLTEAGYIGDDIESVVSKLLAAADNDVERCQKGIIFIDEIDKIAKKRNTTSRDVSGESVQQGLLKLLEGSEVEVPVGATSKNSMAPLVTVNTRNILFICGGAFPDLEEIIKTRLTANSSIGFQAQLRDQYDKDENILSHVTFDDLRNFGMIPEFLGRLPVVVPLQPLTRDMLVRILKEPKNAILKQYQKLLALDGVELKFDDDAIEEIAQLAIEKKTGARALRSIIEEFMLDIMYEIPKDKNIGTVTITKDYILKKGGPRIGLKGVAELPG